MPHNPIIEKQSISRIDISFKIPINRIGVLFQGQRYIRVLQSGEGPSLNERTNLGDLLVYILDKAPHTLKWRVQLPTGGDKYFLNTTIDLKYQVSDYPRMIEQDVKDTETLLTRSLEPALRKISRQYGFHQYTEADTRLEEEIAQFDFPNQCGLRLIDPPAVVIDLTEADHKTIKNLLDLEKAKRVPQPAEHVEDLSTSDPATKFHVTVNLSYRLKNEAELPSDSLAEVEKLLWPKLRGVLRKAARRFGVIDIAKADDAMQESLQELLDDGVQDFGVKIESAMVSVDLNEDARKQYVELAEVQHKALIEKAKLEGLKSGKDFYAELIKQGNWAVLAVAASKGEISTEDLYQRLSQQEQERLKMQISMLKDLRADNAKDETQDWDVSQGLMDTIAKQIAGLPASKRSLPAPDSESTKETKTRKKEDKTEEEK